MTYLNLKYTKGDWIGRYSTGKKQYAACEEKEKKQNSKSKK